MKEQILICSVCGAELTEDTANKLNGRIYCKHCFSENTVICDCCRERISASDAIFEDGITLCHHCHEYHYTNCEDCGGLIHRDDANYHNDYPYCDECYERFSHSSINSYDYKPEPVFYGSGDLFYGIELEIDGGGEYDSNATRILDIANSDNNVLYAKHDGSLNEGFELVSDPCTLDYHKNNINWQGIMDTAVNLGYCSHNTDSCGLHIHVNRSAFGDTYEEQEQVIARIVYFVEHHWNELVRFSRRSKSNLDRWAARYATISDSAQKTYKDAKNKHLGRYVAVNLTNSATIEFRIFRGTLKYKTMLAALQLTDEICRIAISHDDEALESMSWSDFVLQLRDKPELIEYLKSKRLYVNELTLKGADM